MCGSGSVMGMSVVGVSVLGVSVLGSGAGLFVYGLLSLQGEDVKSLLKAAMGRSGSSIHVVPACSSEVASVVPQMVGGVLPSVNALLQLNPWSVLPSPQSTFEGYDDGLEGVLCMLKELGLEDYCDRFRKEMVRG